MHKSIGNTAKIIRLESSQFIRNAEKYSEFLYNTFNTKGFPVDMVILVNSLKKDGDLNPVYCGYCATQPELPEIWIDHWKDLNRDDDSFWETFYNAEVGQVILDREYAYMGNESQKKFHDAVYPFVGDFDVVMTPLFRNERSFSGLLLYKFGKDNFFNLPETVEIGKCSEAINYVIKKEDLGEDFIRNSLD